jgi:hypothetical protein
MASLYEIDNAIIDCFDEETGAIIDKEKFEELSITRDEKIEKVALYYKNCISDAKAYKEEKALFAEKQKRAETIAESLKDYLQNALEGYKFKTSKVEIAYSKSTVLNVIDLEKIDKNFLSYEPKVDKKGIKQAMKEGEIIEGVELVEKTNLRIK